MMTFLVSFCDDEHAAEVLGYFHGLGFSSRLQKKQLSGRECIVTYRVFREVTK